MSTDFKPLEIPPGVVSLGTKNMHSSNYAEVNMIRWRDGQMEPIGGQAQLSNIVAGVEKYKFASVCRAVHAWMDLSSILHIAYLCEMNVYVDTGGVITEITPTGGIVGPAPIGVGGYGDLDYGDSTYGTARASHGIPSIRDIPPDFSVDNFGQILLVQTSPDGRLLSWDPTAVAGTLLTRVKSNVDSTTLSPLGRSFVVTQERFVMMFGVLDNASGSSRRFGWCDQENYTDWNFANVANKAGFYDVEPASPILSAIAGKFGVLFFTGRKAYKSTFEGLPYIYNYEEVADNCTPWSPKSIDTTSSQTMWMSEQGMFSFDGTTITPIAMSIRSWIDDDHDERAVRETSFSVHIADYNEFWWFFTQNGGTYPTRAAIYNYKEGWFSQAQMTRSAGCNSSYIADPILTDGVKAYFHTDDGMVYAGCDFPWVETFDLNLTSGSRLVTVKQLLPDIDGNYDQLRYSLFYRNSRSAGTGEQRTAPVPVRPDGYVDFRTTGRDIRLRIEVVGPLVSPFSLGQHLIDAVPRGDR